MFFLLSFSQATDRRHFWSDACFDLIPSCVTLVFFPESNNVWSQLLSCRGTGFFILFLIFIESYSCFTNYPASPGCFSPRDNSPRPCPFLMGTVCLAHKILAHFEGSSTSPHWKAIARCKHSESCVLGQSFHARKRQTLPSFVQVSLLRLHSEQSLLAQHIGYHITKSGEFFSWTF